MDETAKRNGSSLQGYRAGFLEAAFINFNSLNDWYSNLRAKRESSLTLNTDVYHYTSLTGFHGIIKSGGFWASDNRFLNDAEETTHGAQLAAEVLSFRRKKTSSAAFSKILDKVSDLILERPKVGHLVACFSTARDSLEQWRGYGGTTGVCLRLAPSKENQRHVFFGPHQLPWRVTYDWRSKVITLLSIIRRYEKECLLDEKHMPGRWPYNHDENYVEYLHQSIATAVGTFKHPGFAQESEIRIIIPKSCHGDYNGGLNFRVSPLGLIPYLCTGDMENNPGLLPISEVLVGPSGRQELVVESVRTFLRHSGYENVAVTPSKVPYRA